MFEKLAVSILAEDRPSIFSLLTFCLSLGLRLVELLIMVVFVSGLAEFLFPTILKIQLTLSNPSFAILILLMLSLSALVRWPLVYIRSALEVVFGLDTRTLLQRLKEQLINGLTIIIPVWIMTLVLFLAIVKVNFYVWGALVLVLCWVSVLIMFWWPALKIRLGFGKLRKVHPEELPEGLADFMVKWADKTGLGPDSLRINEHYESGLKSPWLAGRYLIIPQKALSLFSPAVLKSQILVAIAGRLVGVPQKILLMRVVSLSLMAPISMIFVGTMGVWGSPLMVSPVLIPVLWLAVWLSVLVSELVVLFFKRSLKVLLDSLAVIITRDATAMISGFEILSRFNLRPWAEAWWRQFFRSTWAPEVQVRLLKENMAILDLKSQKH